MIPVSLVFLALRVSLSTGDMGIKILIGWDPDNGRPSSAWETTQYSTSEVLRASEYREPQSQEQFPGDMQNAGMTEGKLKLANRTKKYLGYIFKGLICKVHLQRWIVLQRNSKYILEMCVQFHFSLSLVYYTLL